MTTAHNDAELVPTGRFEWERLVRRIIMPQPVKLLALVLATYADPDGSRVRPGNDVLADVLDCSERTVKRFLSTLRDDYGLLHLVVRGGGRGAKGRAAVYCLTVPTDLLDRVELLPPSERSTVSRDNQVSPQSPETEDIQTSPQCGQSPVDDPETQDTNVAHENDFQGPNNDVPNPLGGQNDQLGGQPAWPTTTHSTNHTDHPTTPEPAQPPTARDEPPASQNDHSESGEPRASPPARCDHGLSRRNRPDGTPTCALCRRNIPTTQEPT